MYIYKGLWGVQICWNIFAQYHKPTPLSCLIWADWKKRALPLFAQSIDRLTGAIFKAN